jgi:HPt (histidine-containing phosphotransfer) domain-containing protein
MDGIDLKKQSEEIGIDVINLLSLYTLFVEQTESDIADMETFILGKDSKSLRDMAHHIKGASLNLELYRIVDFAKTLQELSEHSDWDGIKSVFDNLTIHFHELKKYLENLQNEERTS